MKLISLRQYIKGTTYRVFCEDEKKYTGKIYSSKLEANTEALNHSLGNEHITKVRTIIFK
jgi:hypothetical protein